MSFASALYFNVKFNQQDNEILKAASLVCFYEFARGLIFDDVSRHRAGRDR